MRPGSPTEFDEIRRYDTSIPTFTDVLLRFSRESGRPLADLDPVVAIAGVPGENATVVERSRWVISRDGLSSLFGKAPIILNEVAAQAWALRGSSSGVARIFGDRVPNLSQKGRFAFLTFAEGVGTAILDTDETGRFCVLEAEGGQLDFAPISEDERALAALIPRLSDAAVSWEQVLMLRRDTRTDGLAERDRVFARLLARFVSNLIYTTGAWDGAFLAGDLLPPSSVLEREFDAALAARRPYARQLAKATVARVVQTDSVLRGCRVLMTECRRAPGPGAPRGEA